MKVLAGILATSGAILNLIGVLLLFFFGMPFRLRGKAPHLDLREQTDAERRDDTRYDVYGYAGVFSIVLATLLQSAAAWVAFCAV